MKQLVLVTLTLLLAAGAVLAQGPGGMMGGGGAAVLVNTPKGLFALRGGVLAKIDLTTMQTKQDFPLFGAMPAAPAVDADQATRMQYYSEMQKRNAPAIMFATGDSLVVVIGDNFARLNQETFKVETTADLSPLTKAAETTGNGGFRMPEPAPGYLQVGNTLYLMRSQEMLSISITDGKILARASLPKELQPVQRNFGGGGRNGGNGGGNRNRGGGGAAGN